MKKVVILILVLVMMVSMVGCGKKEIEEFPKPSSIDLELYEASLDMYIYMFDVIYNDEKFDDEEYEKIREPFEEIAKDDTGMSKNDIIFEGHIYNIESYVYGWQTGIITKDKKKQKEELRKFKIAEGSLIEFLKDCE